MDVLVNRGLSLHWCGLLFDGAGCIDAAVSPNMCKFRENSGMLTLVVALASSLWPMTKEALLHQFRSKNFQDRFFPRSRTAEPASLKDARKLDPTITLEDIKTCKENSVERKNTIKRLQ